MFRFLINPNDIQDAIDILENNHIPFDTDGYGRLMITKDYASEATNIWDETGIDYDEI